MILVGIASYSRLERVAAAATGTLRTFARVRRRAFGATAPRTETAYLYNTGWIYSARDILLNW